MRKSRIFFLRSKTSNYYFHNLTRGQKWYLSLFFLFSSAPWLIITLWQCLFVLCLFFVFFLPSPLLHKSSGLVLQEIPSGTLPPTGIRLLLMSMWQYIVPFVLLHLLALSSYYFIIIFYLQARKFRSISLRWCDYQCTWWCQCSDKPTCRCQLDHHCWRVCFLALILSQLLSSSIFSQYPQTLILLSSLAVGTGGISVQNGGTLQVWNSKYFLGMKLISR